MSDRTNNIGGIIDRINEEEIDLPAPCRETLDRVSVASIGIVGDISCRMAANSAFENIVLAIVSALYHSKTAKKLPNITEMNIV